MNRPIQKWWKLPIDPVRGLRRLPAASAHPRLQLDFLLLFIAAVAAYWGVWHLGFAWDDDTFLTANPLIRAHDGLFRFWCTAQAPDYWPVSSSTLWLEWRLWGMKAGGYHVTNLLLHLAECGLLWRLLERLKFPGAYVAALLFAVHPVNVESVAWIAQRKNLMAMLFYLLALDCYVRGLDGDSQARESRPRFGPWTGLSLGLFTLGLLSKGSVATLPGVLILILWWRRQLTWGRVLRLAPFFLVAAGFVGVNLWFQRHGGGAPIRVASVGQRLLGAPAVVWFYLAKAVYPVGLSFEYSTWKVEVTQWIWWMPLAAALGLTAGLIRWGRTSGRVFLLAWLYFGLTLLPVMGLADVYFMRYSLVADHYQHLALIALAALGGAAWWQARRRWGATVPGMAVGILVVALAVQTQRLSRNYRDRETLFRATVSTNPEAWMAQNNLGILLLDRNRPEEAIFRFQEALRANPVYPEASIDWGNAELKRGRPQEAARHYQIALATASPFDREAHLDWGHALFDLGRPEEAAAQYRAALAIDNKYSEAYYSLGNVRFSEGRSEEAIEAYRAALRLRADDSASLNNLGAALLRAGRPAEAVLAYQRALQIAPHDSSIADNLRKARAAASARP